MYIPNPYFSNVPSIGDLSLEYIFLENGYPVLFTCVSDNRLYLCVCCDVYKEQRWLITPISTSGLLDVINGVRSVRSAFANETEVGCVAVWTKEDKQEKYSIIPCSDFANDDLPDDDLYLNELDDPDFIEYGEMVFNRDNVSEEISRMKYVGSDNKSATSFKVRSVNLRYLTDMNSAWETQKSHLQHESNILSNDKMHISCNNVMNQPELPYAS